MNPEQKNRLGKAFIRRKLKTEGYVTYAKIFDKIPFRLLDYSSPYVAYFHPGKGYIAVHPSLSPDQMSMVVRHEILHQYLNHEERLLRKLARDHKLNYDELDDLTLEELHNELYQDKTFNIAGDYEISNRGYTEKDKETARNLIFNGTVISGLVTEDKHPGWVNLSLEEMYDKLKKEMKDDKPEDEEKSVLGKLIDETTFVDIDGNVWGA